MAAKDNDFIDIYYQIQNNIPSTLIKYKSILRDGVIKYPTEFLHCLEFSGSAPHNLQLKIGSVIIMQINISQPLCNGNRHVVRK